jgi:hypothetical protein
MRDFTFDIYRNLCNVILKRHTPINVLGYLQHPPEYAAIIRHDVDKKPQNALIMAGIEQELGISSTYYFRTVPDSFNLHIIQEIHDMGHEIGYHYEVLDKVNGDYSKAIKLFEHELSLFPYQIQTICMHGNPMTPWDNRDLWKKYDYKQFGLAGEAYLSLDFSKIRYFSDTGRAWHDRYSVKDITDNKDDRTTNISDTFDLVNYIHGLSEPLCIVTHPQRWNDAYDSWMLELVSQSVKNIGKRAINIFKKGRD